ncbi:MAG: CidA/LrgA family protein [Pseudorhodobacter sp.]|nr:CidA/LrgA family protein [Rhizobacter sp.]
MNDATHTDTQNVTQSDTDQRADALAGLAWLLLFQSMGEVLARGTSLGLPGPVIGMLLLLLALRFASVSRAVSQTARILLEHLSLLFVPVGVGVMTHLALISQYGVRMLVTLVVSTWIGLAVTALVLRGMLKADSR